MMVKLGHRGSVFIVGLIKSRCLIRAALVMGNWEGTGCFYLISKQKDKRARSGKRVRVLNDRT